MVTLNEGFYEAHLCKMPTFLCYVCKRDNFLIALIPEGTSALDGETLPREVPVSPKATWPYIHPDNLTPLKDPTPYVNTAQDLIKFVFTNLGKLEVSRRQKSRLEASAQSQPSCIEPPICPHKRPGGQAICSDD